MSRRHARVLRTILDHQLGGAKAGLLDELVAATKWTYLNRGEVLFEAGEKGDSLGFVVAGKLEVLVPDSQERARPSRFVGAGESVGEIAWILGSGRTATVRAIRDTTVARLTRASIEQILRSHPELALLLARGTIERLIRRETESPSTRSIRSIALIPHSPEIDLAAFGRRLQLALLRHGKTAYLDRRIVDQSLGLHRKATDSQISKFDLGLNTLLEKVERDHDWVLYEALPIVDAWTTKCLHQADKVLLVGRATDAPEPGAIERFLDSQKDLTFPDGVDLVLVQPQADKRPSSASGWLSSRSGMRHHHVAWTLDTGFDRLARQLTGKAIGLVLGGGGARGFAHIGVIRALRTAGIAVDAIGGTSIGAVIASLLALGWSDEQILEVCTTRFVENNPLGDYTLPLVSIVAGKKLRQTILGAIGATLIEDLWLPFFAVSCNLSRQRAEVHEKGLLWRALRATVSLPGILPPVLEDGDLLVDGGVIDNLPIGIMQQRLQGTIIGVDLQVSHEDSLGLDEMPSALEILASRVLPFRARVNAPSIAGLISKCATLGDASRREERPRDLILNPPVGGFELLDWHRIHALVEIGYRHASERLDEWLRTSGHAKRQVGLSDSRAILEQREFFPRPASSCRI